MAQELSSEAVPISPSSSDAQPLLVSVNISLDPLISLTNPETPKFCVSITSHASRAITVFTVHTVLNQTRPLNGNTFSMVDLDTNEKLHLANSENGRRPAYHMQLGDHDEIYYLTLPPQTTISITRPFSFIIEGSRRYPNANPSLFTKGPAEDAFRNLELGHRYCIAVEFLCIGWWRYGTKEEVLAPATATTGIMRGKAEVPPIRIENVKSVEFKIVE